MICAAALRLELGGVVEGLFGGVGGVGRRLVLGWIALSVRKKL